MSPPEGPRIVLGAVDYVTKPFDAAELRARLCASLRRKQHHDLMARKIMVDELTHLWNRLILTIAWTL